MLELKSLSLRLRLRGKSKNISFGGVSPVSSDSEISFAFFGIELLSRTVSLPRRLIRIISSLYFGVLLPSYRRTIFGKDSLII